MFSNYPHADNRWADGLNCRRCRFGGWVVSLGRGLDAIGEARLLRVALADAVGGPLADGLVEFGADGIDDRAGTATDAVLAFRFTLGCPTGPVVHDGPVIVLRNGDDPVRLGDPIVVRLAAGFDVFVVDGDVAIAVPALVFVGKSQHVPEFVGGHPGALSPPERGDVDVDARAGAKTIKRRVVAGVGFAGEEDVRFLVSARDKGDVGSGGHPQLHGLPGGLCLFRGQFGNVERNDPFRPGHWLLGVGVPMGGIRGWFWFVCLAEWCEQPECQNSEKERFG